MPTRECKPLLDICGPDIYSRNAFRLLGADVDMKGRRIKRKEKELQAALEVGDLADEYSDALRPDPLPTREELSQAGRALTDAQQRFIHEFFWFWPLEWGKSGSDEILKLIRADEVREARERWEGIAANGNGASVAAKHNLAVLGHWLVLDREQTILAASGGTEPTQEQRERLDAAWDLAFEHWTPLCKSESFWSVQADRIRSLDDPRLTTGFLRRFQQSLPIAFDNINADMAVAYCDREMYARAKDHVRIMKETNAGDDDVDASLRRATEPLQRRSDHAIETATSQLLHNKTEGKRRCLELFNTVTSILNILEVLLGTETQEYIDTCDRVAEGMLQCQVTYGNETEDWKGSVPLLEAAISVARGAKISSRIEGNLRIVRENTRGSVCWFCGTRPKEEEHSVKVALKKPIEWQEIRGNPEQYRDTLGELLSQVLPELTGSASSIIAGNAPFSLEPLSAAVRGDPGAIVNLLDNIFHDDQEILTQQMTIAVPSCRICRAVHRGRVAETVGQVEEKVEAAKAAIEHEASMLEALEGNITWHIQAMKEAWLLRKWRLSSALKSLRKLEKECNLRHQQAQEELVRLESDLEVRKVQSDVNGFAYRERWPEVIEAIKDGFHYF